MIELLEQFDRSDFKPKPLPRLLAPPVSKPGVLTGLILALLTLLPSMLPKSGVTQGAVLGITFAIGYAFGATWQWAWHFLEMPAPSGRFWRATAWLAFVVLAYFLGSNLWRHVGWQNTVRQTFGMEPVSPVVWLLIVPVSLLFAALIFVLARSLRKLFNIIVRWLDRHLPRRLALLIGGVAFTALLWGLWSGVLVDGFFALANQVMAPLDASTDEGITRPDSPNRSGSPGSLVEWSTLGRQGRTFVSTGPTVGDLNLFHGGGALEPIRVYAGLRSAPTVEERAMLVLNELIRTNAFEREVLVVATTTGTGKLETNAMDSLDFVTKGDVAVAGVQYSYLSSVLSLLGDEDEVKETSQVVFDTIHGYWSALPEDDRPEFYLYGLSLGAFGVESILTSIEIINSPIDGALLVGPPFVSELWSQLIEERDPGSTPALPTYEQGRTVRFTNEHSVASLSSGEWGGTRILYLQNASDPIVFFDPDLLLDQPDWLREGQRGVEINEGFIWIPFVTMWQVLTDLASAGSVPEGFGHLYTKQANADAWIAVTQPEDWSPADTERLMQHLSTLGPSRYPG